jgi:hypothetical protein
MPPWRESGRATRSYRVWRGQDDPNGVLVATTFDSREAADAMVKNPALPDAMGRAGVEPASVETQYLDEVASETR